MQVEILPAAPLPGGVKVARRFVKPHGVGASPTLAANFGRQADISWLHLSRKQDRHRRGRSITDAFRQTKPTTKGNLMRPAIYNQRPLLFRKSYKPNRIIRVLPATKWNLMFRPSRADPQ